MAHQFGKRRETVGQQFATIVIHRGLLKNNLQAMDESCKDASLKYRETFKVAEDLVKDGVTDPMPKDLAPDWSGQTHVWSLKIGAYHDGEAYGGKSGESGEFRMSNCSDIERLCFESVGYFQTYIMKGMAHGSWNDATYTLMVRSVWIVGWSM